jgi:uncharacterized protein YoaH (UPF0181 family)
MGRKADHERNKLMVARIHMLHHDGMTVEEAIKQVAEEKRASRKHLLKLWGLHQHDERWAPARAMLEALRGPRSILATPPPRELLPPDWDQE